MYIVFYSTNCKYSMQFISTLQRTGEERFFKKVCVDSREGREFAISKYSIKKVPTIIVNDQIIDGVNALQWLQKKVKASATSSMSTRQNKESYSRPQGQGQTVSVVGGYVPNSSFDSVGGSAEFVMSSHAGLRGTHSIITPSEDSEVQKSTFILPSDNITNGANIDGKRKDKSSKFESEYEQLKRSRE